MNIQMNIQRKNVLMTAMFVVAAGSANIASAHTYNEDLTNAASPPTPIPSSVRAAVAARTRII